MRHRNHIGLLLLFSSALFLSSCHDTLFGDRSYSPSADFSGSGCDSGGTPVRVSIPFSAPMMTNPGLRGASLRANNTFTVQNESGIIAETSRLLVFDGGDKLLYRAPITSIVPESDPNYNKGHVTAMLKETSTKVRLVLLPNLEPESIQAVDKAESGADRKTLLSSLKFNLPIDGDKLNWDPAKGLPMWGESTEDKIDHNATASGTDVLTLNHTIHLLRAVSRVDVGLNMTDLTNKGVKDADFDEKAQALKGKVASANGTLIDVQYAIKEVYFFNANSTGRVAPDEANLEDPKDNDPKKAKAVTLPNPTPSKIADKLDLSSALEDNLLKRVIYLPEASNPASSGNTTAGTGTGGSTSQPGSTNPGDPKVYSERPYLVVGLSWKPLSGSGSESNVTYYRIDFLKRTGTEETTPSVATYEYIPLLRNHRYKVNISRINGEGFKSIEDAKKGPAANIMYNVTQWDESTISDILYDGQYTLSVTEDHFNLGKYGSQPTFDVRTSWPHGWKIEVPEKVYLGTTETVNSLYSATETDHASWIDFNKTSSTSAGETKDVVTTVAENTTGQPRTGYFYVVAGRMRWLITVNQSDKADLHLKIFEDPEGTKPTSYIEIHQEGLAVRTIAGNPDYDTVEEMGGYRRFYVQTDPYQDPNKTGAIETLFPSLKENGGSRFLFFDFTKKDLLPLDVDADQLLTLNGEPVPKWDPNDPAINLDTYVKAYPSYWKDPSNKKGGEFFRYTGKNNMWEVIVTAYPMVDRFEAFEIKTNEYVTSLSDGTSTASAKVRIQQIEYNVALYEDPGLTQLISVQDVNVFLMNGGKRNFYVKSNVPARMFIKKQYQDPELLESVPLRTNNDILNDEDYPIIGSRLNGSEATDRNSAIDISPNLSGSSVSFDVLNDIADAKLLLAFAKFDLSVNSDGDPRLSTIKSKEYTSSFISAKPQPEANSYMMELGGIAFLIPTQSRINRAADWYNSNMEQPKDWFEISSEESTPNGDKISDWNSYKKKHALNKLANDDNYTLEVLWADQSSVTTKGFREPILSDQSTQKAPLKALFKVQYQGSEYAAIFPGEDAEDNYGNLVFALRSGKIDPVNRALLHANEKDKKAILWSWHIMLFRKGKIPTGLTTAGTGPTQIYNAKLIQYEYTKDQLDVFSTPPASMPYDLGAFSQSGKNYNSRMTQYDPSHRLIGMFYQWGRKDPFPKIQKVNGKPLDGATDLIRFVNGEGKEVTFTVSEFTCSMKESIEAPMTIFRSKGGWKWLTESIRDRELAGNEATALFQKAKLWGGGAPVGPPTARRALVRQTQKTVFDPCPYGFYVPCPGNDFSQIFSGGNKNDNTKRFHANVVMNKSDQRKSASGGSYTATFGVSTDVGDADGIVFATSTSYTNQSQYPGVFIARGGLSGVLVTINDDFTASSEGAMTAPVRPFVNYAESDYEIYRSYSR